MYMERHLKRPYYPSNVTGSYAYGNDFLAVKRLVFPYFINTAYCITNLNVDNHQGYIEDVFPDKFIKLRKCLAGVT